MQKFKETGNSRYVCRNELNNTCFQHGMVYRDFKDLPKRTASDKVLYENAFKIASDPSITDIYADWHRCSLNVLIRGLDRHKQESLKIKN